MNIFEFAMQMEKDGEEYYRSLAQRSGHQGMAAILNRLADDEAGHYRTFEKLKGNAAAQGTQTTILADARNIFAEMREQAGEFEFPGAENELYKKAIELEEKSEKFYLEKAGEADDPQVKDILLKIADEEKRHIFLLNHVMDFISRPQSWIENAEFNHLDDY